MMDAMRALAGLLLCVTAIGAAPADGYFELGLDYLGKGFYGRARAAFAESLVRAPGQPVTLAFLGVACAAQGRDPRESAAILREAYRRMPAGKALRLDLRRLLPSAAALAAIERDHAARLGGSAGAGRRAVLSVLAFLQVHDGSPATAPALGLLRSDDPEDAFAAALAGATGAPASP